MGFFNLELNLLGKTFLALAAAKIATPIIRDVVHAADAAATDKIRKVLNVPKPLAEAVSRAVATEEHEFDQEAFDRKYDECVTPEMREETKRNLRALGYDV